MAKILAGKMKTAQNFQVQITPRRQNEGGDFFQKTVFFLNFLDFCCFLHSTETGPF